MSFLNDHDSRMASLRMSSAQFAVALQARGFVYDAGTNRWNGPFGVSVPGDRPAPAEPPAPGSVEERDLIRTNDDLDRAYARGSAVRYADTQIAGRRKLV